MKLRFVGLLACLLAGCAAASPKAERFVRTDHSFLPSWRSEPSKVLVQDKEVALETPFKAVGVLELEGREAETQALFLERAAQAGAAEGCDVLLMREAHGAVRQFVCGVNGVGELERLKSMKEAVATAADLRR
jgi:hypothetical protein